MNLLEALSARQKLARGGIKISYAKQLIKELYLFTLKDLVNDFKMPPLDDNDILGYIKDYDQWHHKVFLILHLRKAGK